MRTLVPGQWYLLFTCRRCELRQVLFPDLSNGKAKITATYGVNCRQCGHHGEYDSEMIERFQYLAGVAEPAASRSVARRRGATPDINRHL